MKLFFSYGSIFIVVYGLLLSFYNDRLRLRLSEVAVFENRLPVTDAKFIKKVENIFVPRHIAKPPHMLAAVKLISKDINY